MIIKAIYDKTVCVFVTSFFSEYVLVDYGMPQSSVFGPFFFT